MYIPHYMTHLFEKIDTVYIEPMFSKNYYFRIHMEI